MLQSFVLQNSSLNCKSTKPENVAHLVNVKGLHKLVIRTYFKHPIQYLACYMQNSLNFNKTLPHLTALTPMKPAFFVLFGFI